ncbi:MAG: hypothetical protein ACOYIE_09890 [Agathobaculum sp.]
MQSGDKSRCKTLFYSFFPFENPKTAPFAAKKAVPLRDGLSLSKKYFVDMDVHNTRGSAHKIAFAAQMHKKSGHVPDVLYFEREKVSA